MRVMPSMYGDVGTRGDSYLCGEIALSLLKHVS